MLLLRNTWLPLLGILVASCHPLPPPGAAKPAEAPVLELPVVPSKAPELARDWEAARAVFEQRCVVCHGCYDAPCQLVMSSFEGIDRGGSHDKVYEASRLLAAEPSRLFIDAPSTEAWRNRGFHPVLPATAGKAETSLLVRMLEQKRKHPLPAGGKLPEGFEFGADREEHCPALAEFEDFVEEHPSWGMPYALPALTQDEEDTLRRWAEARAPHEGESALPAPLAKSVAEWESFFNQGELKAQLMARYLYEHLFIGALYFDQLDSGTFFRLVRSRTPPGVPVDEIATRRPFDDPGRQRFYYRLRHQTATRLDKTHMPYALNPARLARWQELFLAPNYEVKELPSYAPEVGSNPFRAFAAIPVRSRYRMMLDEAEFTLMGFIKGPVCRGQVALDVIQDRFWVTFVNPDLPLVAAEGQLLAQESEHLDLPAEDGSNGNLVAWLRYARHHQDFLEAKTRFLAKHAEKGGKISLAALWDGDGNNPNAALTVFRHFDSATVVRGLVGEHPKTAWVISYAVLERIHYLLVAGFDVFGNVGHQINTRLYMDFLRMESEHNFLVFLPRARRRQLVDAWYRGVRGSVKDQVYGDVARVDLDTAIPYKTATPEHELYDLLRQHLEKVDEHRFDRPSELQREAITQLSGLRTDAVAQFPEITFVEVKSSAGNEFFTLVRDTSYSNVAHLFREQNRRLPAEDRMTIVPGLLGSYPNLFVSVEQEQLPQLLSAAKEACDATHLDALCERFCVRRTSPDFWAFSDRLHDFHKKTRPVQAGLFDYNRLEDR
jgi:hypothetical protein